MKTSRLLSLLTLSLLSASAQAAFTVTIVDPPAGTTLNDIDQAEVILNAPPSGSATFNSLSPTVNFTTNSSPGFVNDDFAFNAVGFVDVINANSGIFNLFVDSDDGFRLRRNGVVIGQFPGLTGNSATTIPNVTLNDGDLLRLTYFERGGGEFVTFRINNVTGALVGDTLSGINIMTLPEPMMPALLGLGAFGVLGQRRRRRA